MAVDVLIKIVVSVLLFAVVLRVGLWGLRVIAQPAPAPLPPGELRKINVRYRCSVCGMEMKVVLAPDEQPAPPRHCLEEMDVVAGPYD